MVDFLYSLVVWDSNVTICYRNLMILYLVNDIFPYLVNDILFKKFVPTLWWTITLLGQSVRIYCFQYLNKHHKLVKQFVNFLLSLCFEMIFACVYIVTNCYTNCKLCNSLTKTWTILLGNTSWLWLFWQGHMGEKQVLPWKCLDAYYADWNCSVDKKLWSSDLGRAS